MFIPVLLQAHRESEDKWKRLSRQVVDMLLPLLARQQVNQETLFMLDNNNKKIGKIGKILKLSAIIVKTYVHKMYSSCSTRYVYA